MTFTSTFLAVLAGIAIWQLIIFIGYSCHLEDNDKFVYFSTCFFSIPLLVLLLIGAKLILFAYGKLFVRADFYFKDEKIITALVAKKDKKLFETNTKSNHYVTFKKIKFKSLPVKGEIYHRGQKNYYNVEVDSYLKKRD